MKVINVVGARPNFMKIAPIHNQMKSGNFFNPLLVHTGQHYDTKMSKYFFDDLGLPEPDIYLDVRSGTHAEQTGTILIKMEKVLLKENPDLVIVVGDVNSTIAASLAAAKLQIQIAHVEAGLRSFDTSMPEEINRKLTDSVSDYLFVTEKSGEENLKKEGVSENKIFFVGNVMIDTLMAHLQKAKNLHTLKQYKVLPQQYAVLTLHRPANVDNKNVIQNIFTALSFIQKQMPIIFPVHPRTKKMIKQFELIDHNENLKNVIFIEPLGYLPFLQLTSQAKIVLTDSGGIQEETTFLKIPCLTLRENTERPSTIEIGTNQLVGTVPDSIIHGFEKAMNGFFKKSQIPPLWDGHTSERILNILASYF